MLMFTISLLLLFPCFALASTTNVKGSPEPKTMTDATVAITVNAKTQNFVSLRSGATLTFDALGPKQLLVISRRRMAGAGQRAKPAPITARGDGHPILTIQVPGTAIGAGRIHDRLEGFPSKQDRSVITVPEGGRTLTLTAAQGGPDFFIRLVDKAHPEVMLMPVGAGLASATPSKAEPKNVQEAARTGEARHEQKKKTRPDKKKKMASSSEDLLPGAGLEMGFGGSPRGTSMVFHLGATGRYPVYKDLISAGGSIGWHRIGVDQKVDTVHPIAGDLSYQADWHTTIIPIIAQGTVHVPARVGPVTPIASLGLGMFLANRSEGSQSATNIAVGPHLAAGVELALKTGLLTSTLSWSEARAELGNRGQNGEPVAETFAVTRLNFAYLYTF
jgi:hypothetical protein